VGNRDIDENNHCFSSLLIIIFTSGFQVFFSFADFNGNLKLVIAFIFILFFIKNLQLKVARFFSQQPKS